ncbi:energy transducer TonB [Aurantivibrio infirmus]
MSRFLNILLIGIFLVSCATTQERSRPSVAKFFEPIYPVEAAKSCIEGYAIGSLTISGEGKVTDVKILQSNPAGIFDEASKVAWLEHEYFPKISEGKGVPFSGYLSKMTFTQEEPCSDPTTIDISHLDTTSKNVIDLARYGDASVVLRAKVLSRERMGPYFYDNIQVKWVIKNETDLNITDTTSMKVLSYSTPRNSQTFFGEATLYLVPTYFYGNDSQELRKDGVYLMLTAGTKHRGVSHINPG